MGYPLHYETFTTGNARFGRKSVPREIGYFTITKFQIIEIVLPLILLTDELYVINPLLRSSL